MASLLQLHCQVCGHEWVPRKSAAPRWCPNCNSTHWASGRVRPPIAEQRALAALRRGEGTPAPSLRVPLSPSQTRRYRLAGVTTAGPWSEVTDPAEQPLSSVDLLDWQEGDYLLTIDPEDGSCLTGDGIHPHDTVHLRPGIQHENGDIVHASGIDSAGRGFTTLKHIYHEPGSDTVELRPSNPASPTIVAPASTITITGVLIGFAHRGKIRRSST